MENDKTTLETVEAEQELDLADLFLYLLRRWKILLASGLAGLVVMAFYAFVLAVPMYEATAQLYVVNSKDSVLNLSDLQIGTYLTSDYQLVFRTWEVNQQVIQNLGLPYSVEELKSMLTVENPSSTRALFITVSSLDPEEAALIANEYASVARQYISNTMLTDTPTMLSMALQPLKPVSPRKGRLSVIGLFAGLFLALVVLTIVYILNDRIITSADVLKYTGALPLAVIPVINARPHGRRRG